MDSPTVAVHDAVLEEAVTLVGEDRTGTTSDVDVHKGILVTKPPPPPPTKKKREWGAGSELSEKR